ncbi:hypothetical protein D9M72_485510 [compost metagenome]
MGGVRGADRDDVQAKVQEFLDRVDRCGDFPRFGCVVGALEVDVADADDDHVVQGAERLQVVAEDRPASCDSDAQGAGSDR